MPTIEDLMFEVQETTITLRNEQWGVIARALKATGGVAPIVEKDASPALGALREIVRQLVYGGPSAD